MLLSVTTISTSKDSAEIDRLIQDEFVPIMRKAQDFVRYFWLDTGAGEGASFGVFKDKAGADESVRLAADFVRTKMSKPPSRLPQLQMITSGTVASSVT